VHPTDINHTKKRKAKKALTTAKLGLRIVRASKSNLDDRGVVRLMPSHSAYRTEAPKRCETLYQSARSTLDHCSRIIATSAATVASEERKLHRLCDVSQKGVEESVAAMSAFESLQALWNGEPEKTSCCICLDYLGFGDEDSMTTATISMTKCGHLYCRGCLRDCMANPNNNHCPSCRKAFHPVNDIVHIDPKKTEDRTVFFAHNGPVMPRIVLEASHMLEESNGLLEPEMWDHLYLAIDEPEGVDDSLDSRVSALPRHFLRHLRACTPGIPVHCAPSDKPASLDLENNCLSSKVKALLRDLPRDERSVVFSVSKASIQHLESVFKMFGIGCRSLFSGQNVEASERAVLEWQQASSTQNVATIPCPVLLVQAGAAASGLTLTAACKMFLMEPFLRHSEEQQACTFPSFVV
jgi:Ring finger domain